MFRRFKHSNQNYDVVSSTRSPHLMAVNVRIRRAASLVNSDDEAVIFVEILELLARIRVEIEGKSKRHSRMQSSSPVSRGQNLRLGVGVVELNGNVVEETHSTAEK